MTIFLVAAVVVAGLAAFMDWRTGHIPNWLTLGGLALAPVAHLVHAIAVGLRGQDAVMEAVWSIVGALVVGIVPLLLYRNDAIGGGDVKLLLALGAILQWRIGFEAEVYSFFAAGLFAPARLAYEGKLFKTLKNSMMIAANPFLPKAKRRQVEPESMTWFRFGPSMFVGTIFAAIVNWRG